jgi:pyruvate dehydrogenase (quinone)
VERLIQWGVDTIFGFPGDGVNGIFEALRTRQDQIRFIQVRHEEAAAFAACGYAKFTGRLGVCLATSGPGGVHLLNGLYDAKADGQPVLAITGHTFHDLIGTKYQQDVALDRLFSDVAAYSELVMDGGHLVNVVDEAVKTSLARRTVAHIQIPKDVQDWTMSDKTRSNANIAGHSADLYAVPRPVPPSSQLDRAAAIANAGRRVAILAGRGALGARAEVLELAERLAAPIVKPLLGKGVVPDDCPYTTGGIGLLGTSASADVLAECDTLLMIGTSFPYMEFYPKPGQARAVQIDLDPSRVGLRYPVEEGLVGDTAQVLREWLPRLQRQADRGFLEEAQRRAAKWRDILRIRGTVQGRPLKPQVVAYQVNRFLADDAIVCSDTGTVTTWAARHVMMRGAMQFSASGMLATMANALPYGVAAAAAYPGRQVVCLVGDGGLSMLMAELATVAKYDLPIKIVVFKNNLLGEIKWEQMVLEGNPQFGVELQPIDFAGVAMNCGAAGFTIENPRDAAGVLKEALAHRGPAVVQAVVDPNEPPMPGKVSTEQAIKFAEALLRGQKAGWDIIKTVVEDKVREVV